MEKGDVIKLQESVDIIAKTTVTILGRLDSMEERMATKQGLQKVELKLQTQINGLETDLKSFKVETRENFDTLNGKFDDLADTLNNHDHRIEKLEDKVFA